MEGKWRKSGVKMERKWREIAHFSLFVVAESETASLMSIEE